MKRLVAFTSQDDCPVRIEKLACEYRSFVQSTPLKGGREEGVHASVNFRIRQVPVFESNDRAENDSNSENAGAPDDKEPVKGSVTENSNLEAVEFTFAFFDVFDHFLSGVQGLKGPAKYTAGRKLYKAQWVFDIDGGFSQYHALSFPSQVRYVNGEIWRCDRVECIKWLNDQISESGTLVKTEDIFPDGNLREDLSEQG